MPDSSVMANWAQVISVPLAIIAILVSVWLYLRGRKKRSLVCQLYPISSPLILGTGTLRSDLEIHYKGERIENLSIMRVQVKNIGNVEIRLDDVEIPLTLTFAPDTKLLSLPRVIDKKPETLKIDWVFHKTDSESSTNIISLDFGSFFNPGDEVTTEFVWVGQPIKPLVSGRIAGVSEIKPLPSYDPKVWRKWVWLYRTTVFLMILGLLCILRLGWFLFLKSSWSGIFGLIVGLVVGFIFSGILSALLVQLREKRVLLGRKLY